MFLGNFESHTNKNSIFLKNFESHTNKNSIFLKNFHTPQKKWLFLKKCFYMIIANELAVGFSHQSLYNFLKRYSNLEKILFILK